MFDDPEQIALWGPPLEPEPCMVSLSDRWCIQALISPEDVDWVRKYKWCHTYGSGQRVRLMGQFYQKGQTKLYARRTVREYGRGKTIWLHREICHKVHGPPPTEPHVCDHLDGDSLNCQRENLRWATLSQNAKNLFGAAWLQLRMDL